MAILKLYTYPDKVLSQKCEPVAEVTDEIRRFLDDMLETMYADKGVGLAAPQVGVTKRIIVIDDKVSEDGTPGPNPRFLVNPEIIRKSEDTIWFNEGCLSVPGQCAEVERHRAVTVRYLDYDGKEQTLDAEDYLAVILQHETDHLDGILYIDRISRLKRNMIIKKLKNRAKNKSPLLSRHNLNTAARSHTVPPRRVSYLRPFCLNTSRPACPTLSPPLAAIPFVAVRPLSPAAPPQQAALCSLSPGFIPQQRRRRNFPPHCMRFRRQFVLIPQIRRLIRKLHLSHIFPDTIVALRRNTTRHIDFFRQSNITHRNIRPVFEHQFFPKVVKF